MYVTSSVQNPRSLRALRGIGQTGASLARAVDLAISTSLSAYTLQHNRPWSLRCSPNTVMRPTPRIQASGALVGSPVTKNRHFVQRSHLPPARSPADRSVSASPEIGPVPHVFPDSQATLGVAVCGDKIKRHSMVRKLGPGKGKPSEWF